jgi:hypothetical protein
VTTLTRDHTTTSSDGGMWHLWQVGDGRKSITLSVLHTMHLTMPGVPEVARDLVGIVGDSGGVWVFDVILSHTHDPGNPFGCHQHGSDCEADAIVTRHAHPAWAEIVAAGVADDAVLAQLEAIHGQVFGGAA